MPQPGIPMDAQSVHMLEVNVLTQMRDSLQLVNANMQRLNDHMEDVKARVITIESSGYGRRIEEIALDCSKDLASAREYLQAQINDLKAQGNDRESRLRENTSQLNKLGAFMAVAGSIGGAALGIMGTIVVGLLRAKGLS